VILIYIVILGDTYDSEALISAAKGADVVVHECTMLEEDASQAVKRYHSTASEWRRNESKSTVFVL
jgi:ribonuclease Z